jgi:hypothetical protein
MRTRPMGVLGGPAKPPVEGVIVLVLIPGGGVVVGNGFGMTVGGDVCVGGSGTGGFGIGR